MNIAASDAKADRNSGASVYENEIRAEMAEIKGDIAALTKALTGYGKARADGLQDRASDWSDDLVKKSRKSVKKLEKQISRLEKDVETSVRANPVQWFLGALGIGLAVAMLMGKSRD
jgi:ElaB/YqjD/DUF883 family membrane-anchored ribosome-binding protein